MNLGNDALLVLIEKFTSGEDTSIASANAIEVAIDDAFPDDEVMQDTVLMLASYRPEGGAYLYAEQSMKHQLEKVRQRLISQQ
jgi:hypothetical protein